MPRIPAILSHPESGKYLRDSVDTWSLVPTREQASVYAYMRDAQTRADEINIGLHVIPLVENLPSIPELIALGDPIV